MRRQHLSFRRRAFVSYDGRSQAGAEHKDARPLEEGSDGRDRAEGRQAGVPV